MAANSTARRVTDIEERSGRGVVATVDGHSVAAGNSRLMEELGISWQECRSVGTIVHMAVDGAYAGHIVISDVVKPGAREAIAALRRTGVRKTVMLTGDMQKVAAKVAEELGVDDFRAELLPADKVSEVERLLARKGRAASASPSSATASTTRPSSPARTSASPWARWAPMPPSRPPTWC